jgi:hypothetical protein
MLKMRLKTFSTTLSKNIQFLESNIRSESFDINYHYHRVLLTSLNEKRMFRPLPLFLVIDFVKRMIVLCFRRCDRLRCVNQVVRKSLNGQGFLVNLQSDWYKRPWSAVF